MKPYVQVLLLHRFLPLPNGNRKKHFPTHRVLDLDTQEKLVCYTEVASNSFNSFKSLITADKQEYKE